MRKCLSYYSKYFDVRYYAYLYAKTEKNHVYRYLKYSSVSGRLLNTIVTIILVIIGHMTNMSHQMDISIISFYSLRYFAGGIHSKSRIKCMIITIVSMICIVYIGQLLNYYICIPLLLASFVLLIIYSPIDESIITTKARIKNKVISIIIFTFWIYIIVKYPIYTGVITMSLFIECANLVRPHSNKIYIGGKLHG